MLACETFEMPLLRSQSKKNMNVYILIICVHPCLSVVLVFM